MTFIESNWSYDKLGRITMQAVQKGPGPAEIVRQDVAYFGNDDPKTLTHHLGTSSRQFQYSYDPRHQLIGVTTSSPGYFDATYSHGPAGRLASATEAQTISPVPAGSDVRPRAVNYVYGGTDPEQVTALTTVGTGTTYASYLYDDAGNQTLRCTGAIVQGVCSGDSLEYLYDGKDQLRRATKKTSGVVQGSEEYWYDDDGQRVAIVRRDALGAKTELVWFVDEVEAHLDAAGAVTKVYSHVNLGTPVARVTQFPTGPAAVEYQFHGLASSTIAAVESDGTINASFSYTPFGSVVEATNTGGSSAGTPAHPRRHNDKYVDEISDLAYYGARYYDKTLLGWTQSDQRYRDNPDSAGSRPRLGNLYTFVLGNPLRYYDPDGHSPASVARAFVDHAQPVIRLAAQQPKDPVGKTIAAGLVVTAVVAGTLGAVDHLTGGSVDIQSLLATQSITATALKGMAAVTAIAGATHLGPPSDPFRDPDWENEPEILNDRFRVPDGYRERPGDAGTSDAPVDSPLDGASGADWGEPTILRFSGESGGASDDPMSSSGFPWSKKFDDSGYTGAPRQRARADFRNPCLSCNSYRAGSQNQLDKEAAKRFH